MSPSVVNTLTQQKPITTTEKDTLSSPPLTSSPEIPRGKMDPNFNVTHQTENYLKNSPTSSVMDNPNADQNYVDHNSRHQEFDNSDLATPSTDHNHIDHDNIQHYSDFETPNPYACLAEQEQSDVDSISLENIEKAPQTPTLQITPTRAPKNTEEYNSHCKCVAQGGKIVLCSKCKCLFTWDWKRKEFDLFCQCVEQSSYTEICS